MSNPKPINMITVLCNMKTVRTIRFTCRCKFTWTESIPAELHDSTMTCQFECGVCGTQYRLCNKQLERVKEDAYDREKQPFASIRTDNKQQYDS